METENISFTQEYERLMQETIIAPSDDYNTKMQPITELIKVNLPLSLFRYRKINEFSLDAFCRDLIYHSNPQSFNDPHDCLVFIDQKYLRAKIEKVMSPEYLKNTLKAIENNREQLSNSFFYPYNKESPEVQTITKKIEGKSSEDLCKIIELEPEKLQYAEKQFINKMENIEKTMYKHFKSYPKIACFSETIYSTLMWSHYADSHKGFALEYDFIKGQSKCLECEKQCDNYAFMNLFPIIYSNKRYDATNLADFFLINESLKEFGFPNNTSIPDQLVYTKANIYKGVDWKYEREWRSVLTCNGNTNKKEVIVKPKAIYLGAEISSVYRNILINCARTKQMEIYHMIADYSTEEFKLSYMKIE